jgi:hypothetical protein
MHYREQYLLIFLKDKPLVSLHIFYSVAVDGVNTCCCDQVQSSVTLIIADNLTADIWEKRFMLMN